MTGCEHRSLEANGIRMHIAEQGRGPLVLLCHGFPETWYSWRHQLSALAAAGYRVVAPDMRGFGQTDRPADPTQYTQLHMAGDMVGLLDALEVEHAVIVGHDWGGPVAWTCALTRPDRFRAVAALSVPYIPRGVVRPTDGLRFQAGDNFMYMLYFQEPGVAEAELEQDVRSTIRRVLYWGSGESPGRAPKPKTAKFLDLMDDPPTLPAWLTEADVDHYVGEFTRTGFTGGLNWYRNLDRTWDLWPSTRMPGWPRPLSTSPGIAISSTSAGRRPWSISRRACRTSGRPWCCRAAATGPSRSGRRRSTPSSSRS